MPVFRLLVTGRTQRDRFLIYPIMQHFRNQRFSRYLRKRFLEQNEMQRGRYYYRLLTTANKTMFLSSWIERARKESESASCSIVAFIFFMGFFLVLGLSRSCSNENHSENSTTNNNPLNHSNGSTSPPSTEGKGDKLNDLKSLMQYINEDKQQTDNKGKQSLYSISRGKLI